MAVQLLAKLFPSKKITKVGFMSVNAKVKVEAQTTGLFIRGKTSRVCVFYLLIEACVFLIPCIYQECNITGIVKFHLTGGTVSPR